MRTGIALLALGCTPTQTYKNNTAPKARIVSHTTATTVFTNVETDFLGEATDPDQTNSSLTAHWSIEGTVGCPNASVKGDIGSTRCIVTLEEPGTIAVSLEVIDDDGDSDIQDLVLTVVETEVTVDSEITVEDQHNYTASFDVSLGQVDVAIGGDIQLDWCSITTDDRGRPVPDASLISRLELREFTYLPSEIEDALSTGTLSLDDAQSTFIFYNGSALCSVAGRAMRDGYGIQFDPTSALVGAGHSWLLIAQNNDTIPTFDPLASAGVVAGTSGNLDVTLDDPISDLGFLADLLSLQHLSTVSGRDEYTLDWSAVTTDSLGQPFDISKANRLFIANSSDNLVTLQQTLLSLETHADAFYRTSVGNGDSVDLLTAENAEGDSFEGFTEEGIWLVGIECARCTHPAPLLLAVIDVDPPTTR